ncbi:AraC family transcriptional regulator [Dokdonia sinensis]|uniref:AraC family transcriptional regulator n=1 Tax=Dokdonia sinensis TaxID=2479847 RepID=A0A3M0FYG0_9FLAO|nr:AraC family transcriptional regulator [Dokdonia sinensis]RMB57674.1 AraC family transcriptional regulator [Dokdonia sinensis]
MKEYTLKVKNVDDLVPEIADAFGTNYENKFGEFSLEVPEHLGTGNISGINFPNGIGLHIIDCEFVEDTKFTFKNNELNSLRFMYCMKGEMRHRFSSSDDDVIVRRAEHLIVAAKYNEDQAFTFKSKKPVVMCYLEINKTKFQEQLSYDLSMIDEVYYPLFADVNALTQIQQKGYYSLQISDIIDDILTFDDVGLVRTNFLGAKALEAVSLMLRLYKEDSNNDQKKLTLRLADLDNVNAAVKYIENNIDSLTTIPEIAKAVGIEPYRLQEGFKKNYQLTVNDYIKEYRLKRSLSMLTSENMNVSEVVYALGLSSRSYFSKIFKEKYGVAPSSLISSKDETL